MDSLTGYIKKAFEYKDNGDYKIQIHGGGMGCALIRASVFDRLDYPWYDWVNYSASLFLGLLMFKK